MSVATYIAVCRVSLPEKLSINSREVLAKEREESKVERIVGGNRYGDVEHQMKKARVVGMQARQKKYPLRRFR